MRPCTNSTIVGPHFYEDEEMRMFHISSIFAFPWKSKGLIKLSNVWMCSCETQQCEDVVRPQCGDMEDLHNIHYFKVVMLINTQCPVLT